MPEKLLTIKEVSEYLKISEEEVKKLVDAGEIPAYRIGDTFLRFRKEQIDAIRAEVSDIEKAKEANADFEGQEAGRGAHDQTKIERDVSRMEPSLRRYEYSLAEKMKDFFYFNDFYIISLAIIAFLLYLIFR
jgi:excisionase family DNA binding protein